MTIKGVSSAQNNPLMQEWIGINQGSPAFDNYKISHFKPALQFAIQEKLDEINAIVYNAEAATFENTIEALEKVGKRLSRIKAVYGIYSSNISTPEFESVEIEFEPKLAELEDKITQNTELFKRISSVYHSENLSKLTSEQRRLVKIYYDDFVRKGAELNDEDKVVVAEINQKLAGLFTKFSQNLLAEENNQFLELESESDFDGLPIELKDAAIRKAKERNLKSLGCIENTRSSVEPFLTYASSRNLRAKVWTMFIKRGDNGNAQDNNSIIVQILGLRSQRAKLLGYASHAHWTLADTMAKSPEKAMKLMKEVWKPAVARVKIEVEDMQKIVEAEGGQFSIAPWDYRYYAEKVRKDKFDLDQNEVREYLQLDKLRDGMFWVASELFDLNFKPVKDIQVFHPDVSVWVVNNTKNGKHVGLWFFDPFARKGKRSGAWMDSLRLQEKFDGDIPAIVSNNSNFIKGKEGEPVLISWDDATTLFHEFGHALHGLCSDVNYPLLSGTNVVRDYVEFPSQVFENWLLTQEVLKNFALSYKTGKPMPEILLNKIKEATKFNQGFSTVEMVSCALVDMELHMINDEINPAVFEQAILEELNMPEEIVMRHRMPQFAHIFSGDDYAAGYYSYLWSYVICSDAFEAFTEGKGPFDKEVAARLLKYVFSAGNTIDESEGYRLFRGRDAKVDALMRSKNFPVTE